LGEKLDLAEAAAWYRKAADQGHPLAQNELGFFYQQGFGLPEDVTQSLFWYRKAAEAGVASAQFNMGLACLYGTGQVKDEKQSSAWFHKAAEQGDADACQWLAELYVAGQGVTKNETEAYAYCLLAGPNRPRVKEILSGLEKEMPPDKVLVGALRAKQLLNEIAAKMASKRAGK
jgi:TPR repeat protein